MNLNPDYLPPKHQGILEQAVASSQQRRAGTVGRKIGAQALLTAVSRKLLSGIHIIHHRDTETAEKKAI